MDQTECEIEINKGFFIGHALAILISGLGILVFFPFSFETLATQVDVG